MKRGKGFVAGIKSNRWLAGVADGDGLANNQESVLGTNPLNSDTDGDEFDAGFDPLDPTQTLST
jgi:hypothetical protein